MAPTQSKNNEQALTVDDTDRTPNRAHDPESQTEVTFLREVAGPVSCFDGMSLMNLPVSLPSMPMTTSSSPKPIFLSRHRRTAAVACMVGLLGGAAFAATAAELADLSLEQLAQIEITSVSRRPERLSEAAASIYVITGDAIRRAGVTSLAEALRLAPNLQVARIDAAQYAITARGFNNAIGNKLLVLIDGRTVYSPFFSGVFWDQQDLPLDEIDRIEVISGPGAALWGANAVNGVINVITRPAAASEGTAMALAVGSAERLASARHGGAFGADGHYRVYAKSTRLDQTQTGGGTAVRDGHRSDQLGFRVDTALAGDSVTLQGDAFRTRTEHRGFLGSNEIGPLSASGFNLLGRWTRRFGAESALQVQAYYDRSEREDRLLWRPRAEIIDLELQHGFRAGRHKLLWGGGTRRNSDDIGAGVFFGFTPPSRVTHWTNFFAQDSITLSPQLKMTLGLKLEKNDYTGTEHLPTARLAWRLPGDAFVWAAASRAVRAPARLDRDLVLPPTPPYIIAGGPDFVSEVANVIELGHRAQPSPGFSYSVTAFHHDWDRLRSGQSPPNAQVQNMIDGSTHGLEAWAQWQATPAWRLSGGLTLLRQKLRLKPGSADPVGPSNLGNDPERQWSLRSSLNLPGRQELDLLLRRVSALPQPAVPAYTALDLRYAWWPQPNVELSFSAQNLFDRSHPEFGAAADRSAFGRSVLVQVKWSL